MKASTQTGGEEEAQSSLFQRLRAFRSSHEDLLVAGSASRDDDGGSTLKNAPPPRAAAAAAGAGVGAHHESKASCMVTSSTRDAMAATMPTPTLPPSPTSSPPTSSLEYVLPFVLCTEAGPLEVTAASTYTGVVQQLLRVGTAHECRIAAVRERLAHSTSVAPAGGAPQPHQVPPPPPPPRDARAGESMTISYHQQEDCYVGEVSDRKQPVKAASPQSPPLSDLSHASNGGRHPLSSFMSSSQRSLVSTGRSARKGSQEGSTARSAVWSSCGYEAASSRHWRREGIGTLFTDTHRRTFFHGEWARDARHGRGVLNLSHTAVQGVWRRNRLVPGTRLWMQTTNMRGQLTVGSVDGHDEEVAVGGEAVCELSNGCSFHGTINVSSGEGSTSHSGVGCVMDRSPSGTLVRSRYGEYMLWGKVEGKHETASRTGSSDSASTTEAGVLWGESCRRIRLQSSSSFVVVWRRDVSEIDSNGQPSGYGLREDTCATFHSRYFGNFKGGELGGGGGTSYWAYAEPGQRSCWVYVGEVGSHGKFHGRGILWQCGTEEKSDFLYAGQWTTGEMDGFGCFFYPHTRDVWEGELRMGKRYRGGHIVATGQ